MRYKKILLGVIAGVLCLGILNGCSGYSHDFNSSEEAQKHRTKFSLVQKPLSKKIKDAMNVAVISTLARGRN